VTGEPYRPQRALRPVRVSDTVEPAGEKYDAPLTLTCRWPDGETPRGIVIFCHGLGGNRHGFEELSATWAENGYLVVHPTFPDSINVVAAVEPDLGLDPSVDLSGWTAIPAIRARMHEILHAPFFWLERIRVVRALMRGMDTVVASTCGGSARAIPWGIAGHSFGAYTSQLFAGADIDVPGQGSTRFRDERIAAAVLISAQGRAQQGLREGSWNEMDCAVLTVTGTLDRGAKGQHWEWKSEPYTLAPPGGKCLAVFRDADHYFGDMPRPDPEGGNPALRGAVNQLTLAFLDAHLAGDSAAMAWLTSISDHIAGQPVLFERK
jgi:hypothetical protein